MLSNSLAKPIQVPPLHEACKKDDVNQVKKLLSDGFIVNEQDQDGFTPLHFACGHNQIEIVKLLLDKGANPKISNRWGSAPLHLAADLKDPQIINLILSIKYNPQEISKADFKLRDGDNYTLLHRATVRSNYEVLKSLLDWIWKFDTYNEAGYLLAVNNKGETPLHLAVRYASDDLVKLLVDRYDKAQVHAKDNKGNTPLHVAARCGWESTAKILLEHKAKYDSLNNQNETPILIALKHKKNEFAEFLAKKYKAKYISGLEEKLHAQKTNTQIQIKDLHQIIESQNNNIQSQNKKVNELENQITHLTKTLSELQKLIPTVKESIEKSKVKFFN